MNLRLNYNNLKAKIKFRGCSPPNPRLDPPGMGASTARPAVPQWRISLRITWSFRPVHVASLSPACMRPVKPQSTLSLPLCLDSTSSSQCICTSNSVTPYSTSTVAFLTILGGKTINIRTTHEAVSRIPAERALILSVATQESGCPTLLLSHSSCRWDVISPAALLACFNNVVCP